jgi:hypothetical protein
MRTKAFALAVVLLLSGCSDLDNCPDDDGDHVVAEAELSTTDTTSGIYSSCPWEGPRDPFPAKVTLRFVHGLAATPELVTSYVSFAPDESDVTENAGNQGRIRCVDDTEIWIKNDTCEKNFFIRVVASASGETHTDCSCGDRLAGNCPD